MTHPQKHRPLLVILVAFALLALVYAWATPLFEASDELWHFGVVEHIATTGQLPVQVPGEDTAWEQEGSQPPLYYLAAALIAAPFNLGDIEALRQPNPHVKAGVPGAADNKNLVLHDDLHPAFVGTAAAVYAARLFSIALGLVTVGAVYAAARVLLPERPQVAALAAALTAFNPMFLFITASVNNDTLVTAINSLVIWQMLLMLRDGLSTRRSAILSILLALGALSKLSGLVLIPVVAAAGLWTALRRREWRGLGTLAGLMIAAWGALAGWWYLRNITLYGELFGTGTMVAVAGARQGAFTLGTLFAEFEGFRITYWGLFGGVNVLTFPAFYWIMDAVTLAALTGLGVYVWQQRRDREHLITLGLLALSIAGGTLGVVMWTAQTYASQGRLLFPFVAAISPLLALGLRRLRLPVLPAGAALGVFALVVPFASILPAYTPPSSQTALPENAQPIYANFGDVTLIGYASADRRYAPGDGLPVTLYWRVAAPSDRDNSLYLHAVLDDGTIIGKIDTYPGGGRLRTSTWEAGAVYADDYVIPLDADAVGASRLRVSAGWWHYPTETPIPAVDANGAPLDAIMLAAGGFADGQAPPVPDGLTAVDGVTFGGLIALRGYALDGESLTLLWEAVGAPSTEYTVFAHVVDDSGALIGQGDAPPSLPTRYWWRGEQYLTHHTLTLDADAVAGDYTLLVGWYDPADFSRLGIDYPNAAYPLTTLTLP